MLIKKASKTIDFPSPRQVFLVGGAVRDKLLGRKVTERDWVVIGVTREQMLQAGFTQVGKDFPVFLHPETKEEYALARTERKSGTGHTGFECYFKPDVTLEQDLARRDLTINAMALDCNDDLIDPYGGQKDLTNRLLRHVAPAFSEDPLRVFRVARFYAQLADFGFNVDSATIRLMREISSTNELKTLARERVWHEWQLALMSSKPWLFFSLLFECNALKAYDISTNQLDIDALKEATALSDEAIIRFAALCYKQQNFSKQLKAPTKYIELSKLVVDNYQQAIAAKSPASRLDVLYRLDAYRRPARFTEFLLVCQAIAIAKKDQFIKEQLPQDLSLTKLITIKDIDFKLTGKAIAQAIYNQRLSKLRK